ncbi:MAG: DNA repair exonuclease [Alicyclobacillus sp.]|nr:DNA repair exonuclease [Alicyclobacillus sp.]
MTATCRLPTRRQGTRFPLSNAFGKRCVSRRGRRQTGGSRVFSFVHCADLHLDSPLRGLSNRPDAPVEALRGATRQALSNLVQLCIDEQVDFVVIAGDVYDGDWPDYSTGLFFHSQMARLGNHGIPVYMLRGNHDAASAISRRLVLPANVHEFSVHQPATFTLDNVRVALHGQGFAERALHANLVPGYPAPMAGYFNIGVLHTAAEGQEGHEPYAPCRIAELVDKGYDYWALGHIHQRQVLHTQPYVVFPGNLQGRHVHESGAKGCTLVRVRGRPGGGWDVQLAHRSVDVVRWAWCRVSLDGAASFEELVARVADGLAALAAEHAERLLAVRVQLTGCTPLHGALLAERDRTVYEVLNAAALAGAERVWVEQVRVTTQPPGQLADGDHAAWTPVWSAIMTALQDAQLQSNFMQHVQAVERRLGSRLAAEERITEDGLAELLQAAADMVEQLLRRGWPE